MTQPGGGKRIGWFEGVESGRAIGWTWSADEGPLAVKVRAGAGPWRLGLADRYRADVQAAGHGDGMAGFAIRVSPDVPVECLWADTGQPLPRINPRAEQRALLLRIGNARIAFDARRLAENRLVGRAFDLRTRHRLRLRLLDGDAPVAEASATLYRQDAQFGGRDGFHGFEFPSVRRWRELDLEVGHDHRIGVRARLADL